MESTFSPPQETLPPFASSYCFQVSSHGLVHLFLRSKFQALSNPRGLFPFSLGVRRSSNSRPRTSLSIGTPTVTFCDWRPPNRNLLSSPRRSPRNARTTPSVSSCDPCSGSCESSSRQTTAAWRRWSRKRRQRGPMKRGELGPQSQSRTGDADADTGLSLRGYSVTHGAESGCREGRRREVSSDLVFSHPRRLCFLVVPLSFPDPPRSSSEEREKQTLYAPWRSSEMILH